MRKLVLVLIALFVFSSALFAQRFGVEGGYSYLRLEGNTDTQGWEAQPMAFFGQHYAAVGDFTGQYTKAGHLYTYLGGPAYVLHFRKLALFNVHVLAGGISVTPTGLLTFHGLAAAVGCALDVKVHKRIYVRPLEADMVATHAQGAWTYHNYRYGAGVLFMF